MDAYEVRLKSSALKELKGLPKGDAGRVLSSIRALRNEPRPRGAKKLRLGKSLWRIRVGDFRAIYEIDDERRIIRITRIRHRDVAYR